MVTKNDVDKAIASFPATFGLRGFPGQRFVIDRGATDSLNSLASRLQLYVFTTNGDGSTGLAFSKCTVGDLRAELVN